MAEAILLSDGTRSAASVTAVTIKALRNAATVNPDRDSTVAMIGASSRGAPYVPYLLSNAEDAGKVLGNGVAAKRAKKMFRPAGPDGPALPTMYVVNPVPGTPAYLSVPSAVASKTVTIGTGSTLTSLVVASISPVPSAAVPIGTVFNLSGGRTVQLLEALPASGAGTVAIQTLVGTAAVAANTATYVEAAYMLRTKQYREDANSTLLAMTGSASSGYAIKITDNATGDSQSVSKIGLALTISYTGSAVTTFAIGGVTATGTTPPAVTLTGTPLDSYGIRIEITTAGALATAAFRWSKDGGLTYTSGILTAATVVLGATGLTANFPAGPYAVNNVYTATSVSNNKVQIVNVLGVNRLQTIIPGATTEQLDIALVSGLTVRGLATLIAQFGVYQATASRDGVLDASLIDLQAATDIRTPAQLTALVGDAALYFNSTASSLVDYIAGPGAGFAGAGINAYFVGGTTGVLTAADWAKSAAALATKNFAEFVALTDDEAILFALRAANTARASSTSAKFTHFWQGVADSDLPSDSTASNVTNYVAVLDAKLLSINDSRTSFVACVHSDTDPDTGLLVRLKGYEVAAQLAALRCAVGPNEPISGDLITGSAPFPLMPNDALKSRFAEVGATIIEVNDATGALKLGRTVTTYRGEPSPIEESEKGMAVVNSIGSALKLALGELPGKNASTTELNKFKRNVGARLKAFVDRGWLTAGTDASGISQPPYTLILLPTQFQGRLVQLKIFVNPTLEFVSVEASVVARAVEISL